MATPGTAKAKAKGNQVPTTAVPPVVISVTNGVPDKDTVTVNIGGTVRFDNNDSVFYLVRLTDHDKHAAIDVLLPADGSVSFMPDPDAKASDEVDFDILQVTMQNAAKSLPSSAKGVIVASGGGGKIIIGSSVTTNPPPKKASR
jgi:hypothetical protein